MDFEDTIFLGCEAHRPVRAGDCPQVGSNWAKPSPKRKQSAAERLRAERDARFAELGHKVAVWTVMPIAVVVAVAVLAGVVR